MSKVRFINIPTEIHNFRTGDVIPVDGPNGTAKISKDDLLKETAENAAESGLLVLNKGSETTIGDVSKFRLPDDIYKSVELKKVSLTSVNDAVARFSSGKTASNSTCRIYGFVTADSDYKMSITLTGDTAGSQTKKTFSLNLYANERKYFDDSFTCDSATDLSVFFSMRGMTDGNVVFDRCVLVVDGVSVNIDSLTRFVYGSFNSSVSSHNYSGVAMHEEITDDYVRELQIDNGYHYSRSLKKIALTSVNDAVGMGTISFANTGVTGLKFYTLVSSDVDFTLELQFTPNSDGTSPVYVQRTKIFKGKCRLVSVDAAFASTDFTNLYVFVSMRGVSDAAITYERPYVLYSGKYYPLTDLNAWFNIGSFTKTITDNSFVGAPFISELSNPMVDAFRIGELHKDITLKKVTLTSVNDAIGRSTIPFANTGVTGYKLLGVVTADVDTALTILTSSVADGSTTYTITSYRLHKDIPTEIEIDASFASVDLTNLYVFFQMRGVSGATFVYDRFAVKYNGDYYPITDMSVAFNIGSFTKTITDNSFVGVSRNDEILPPMVKPCRLENDIFKAQTLYKITLTSVNDAIASCNTGANPQGVTNVKLVGMITADIDKVVTILVSPKTDGTNAVTRSVVLSANKTKYFEIDFPFSSVDFTNLSVFFQMRGVSDAMFVYDRCYVEVNGERYPIHQLNRFVFGSFTSSVASNNFRGCVGRDEIQGLNKLEGKDILVLGDSISDTQGTNYRYPYYIAQITGATQINYAVSSAGYAKNALYPHPIWGQADTKVCDMVVKAHTNGIACDLVIMAAGTNDWDFAAPLGQLSDVELDTMTNPTFYWYVAKAIKNLIEYYPMATYLVIIPLPRNQPSGSGNQHTVKTATGKTLIDYCNAIKEVCYWFSIPYLDMMQDSNLHLESATAKAQWMPDGLHPSSLYASSIFAPMVINRFNELL